MSDTPTLGLCEAARHLGVSVRALRHAIRVGTLPAVPHLSATATLPADWLSQAQAASETPGHALGRQGKQRVPAFARYRGTSAWRKYSARVREYARFRAAQDQAAQPG